MSKREHSTYCRHVNYRSETTHVNFFRASKLQTVLIAKPRTPKIDKGKKFYSRSGLDSMSLTLLVAMFSSQLAMSRMYLNLNQSSDQITLTAARNIKHDVYGRRQTAKITSAFLFPSCNP